MHTAASHLRFVSHMQKWPTGLGYAEIQIDEKSLQASLVAKEDIPAFCEIGVLVKTNIEPDTADPIAAASAPQTPQEDNAGTPQIGFSEAPAVEGQPIELSEAPAVEGQPAASLGGTEEVPEVKREIAAIEDKSGVPGLLEDLGDGILKVSSEDGLTLRNTRDEDVDFDVGSEFHTIWKAEASQARDGDDDGEDLRLALKVSDSVVDVNSGKMMKVPAWLASLPDDVTIEGQSWESS